MKAWGIALSPGPSPKIWERGEEGRSSQGEVGGQEAVVRVCGLVGSPNKGGNVDLLVSEVLRGAGSQGAETLKLYLGELDVMLCQDCGVDPSPEYCLFDDDMAQIYVALTSYDGIVLGSPVYFNTVSAQAKLVIDRCNCLMPCVRQADGSFVFERRVNRRKKGIFIAVAGDPDQEFDTIQRTVKAFFCWANIGLRDMIRCVNPENELGSVRNDREKRNQAFEAGVRMVARENDIYKE